MIKRLLALIIVLTPIASQAFDLPWSEKARIEECKNKVRERSKALETSHTLRFYTEDTTVLDAGYEELIFGNDSKTSYRVVCYFDKNGKMIDHKWL